MPLRNAEKAVGNNSHLEIDVTTTHETTTVMGQLWKRIKVVRVKYQFSLTFYFERAKKSVLCKIRLYKLTYHEH